MIKLFFAVLFVSIGSLLFAQTPFTGTLTYSNTDTGEVFEKYFTPYIPAKYDISFSGTNIGIKYYGGMFNGVRFALLTTKKQGLIFIDSLKIYTVLKESDMKEKPKKQLVQKLEETEMIMGHTCTKYKIWEDDSTYKNEYHVWVAEDMLIPGIGSLSEMGGEAFINTIPYAVLKMETVAGLNYEVTEITTSKPSDDIYKVPKGYKLVKKLFQKVEPEDEKKKKK